MKGVVGRGGSAGGSRPLRGGRGSGCAGVTSPSGRPRVLGPLCCLGFPLLLLPLVNEVLTSLDDVLEFFCKIEISYKI